MPRPGLGPHITTGANPCLCPSLLIPSNFPTRPCLIRGDKAVKRKAALTMAGGKYQEQLKRPWRTFRW